MENKLENLQVGDEVVVSSILAKHIAVVEHVTNNFVIIAGGQKYNKRTGYQSGHSKDQYIFVPTPQQKEEILNNIQKSKYINQIRKVDLCNLPFEKIKAIYEIIKR